MIVVAFGYYQDTGKNTCALHLERSIRMRTKNAKIARVGFAKKVKSIAYELYKRYGLKPEDYYETPDTYHLKNKALPAIDKTPRDLWILVGNSIRLGCDSIWADHLLETHNHNDFIIIPDLRFPTEFNAVKAVGGLCYMVDREGRRPKDDGADNKLNMSFPWDGIIKNVDNEFKILYKQVEDIAERIAP